MNIGEKIKKLRKKNNMTQVELADMLGMTRGNLSHIENNKVSINVPQLNLFAKALHSTAEELVREAQSGKNLKDTPEVLDLKKMLLDQTQSLSFQSISLSSADRKRMVDLLAGFIYSSKKKKR